MQHTEESTILQRAKDALEQVCDPEIPALTIEDLGILRGVSIADDGWVEVIVTPTYSGCPAMNAIEVNIRAALEDVGLHKVRVRSQLQPAWTTDWMSEAGRDKLRQMGIAPPAAAEMDKRALMGERQALVCPICGSRNTVMISQFGSTSCKALFRCMDCLEPFDYFKCH